MKNIGPFLAFNELWFVKNQRVLLWLLNGPTRRWFRWVLRIKRFDCSLQTRITEIGPNRFSYGDRYFKKKGKWYLQRTAVFRTHPKYGKRIYLAFRPIWWIIHFWDWVFADRYIPKWSYGFATLTAYPDPDPESTTVDGNVVQDTGSSVTWATIRGGAGTSASPSSSSGFAAQIAHGTTGSNWGTMLRSIFLFDTSSIDDAATVSAATFSLYGNAKDTTITQSYGVVASTPASNTNLVASDYANLGTTRYATDITGAGFSTSAYNDWTLNATGISNVSKTGVTKLGVRTSGDIDNSEPGAGSAFTEARIAVYFADQTGTSNDPKLVVTYSTSTAYSITAAQGSYAYTGQASLFKVGHIIVAALGTFTLTGFVSAFKIAHTIVAAVGSYTLTGYSAGLKIARIMVLAVGSYAFTGFNTAFLYGKTLVASVGNFTLTGYSAVLSSLRYLIAEAGEYALTGYASTFKIAHIITAAVGRFVLSGQSALLTLGKHLTAAYGSFTLTGQDAAFKIARILTAAYGVVALVFKNFQLRINGLLAIYSKKYTERGTSYDSKYSSRGTSYSNKYDRL